MNVQKELSRLRRMTPAELRLEYATVFDEQSHSGNKNYLLRRILWGVQARAEGGLSDRARKRAMELAQDSDLRLTSPQREKTKILRFRPKHDPRLPMPGSQLVRKYRGQELRVTVLREGFEFEGDIFKTLSAIARHITNTHTSGPRFFGLKDGKRNAR